MFSFVCLLFLLSGWVCDCIVAGFGVAIWLCLEAFAQPCPVRLRSFLAHLPHENASFVHENLELVKLP